MEMRPAGEDRRKEMQPTAAVGRALYCPPAPSMACLGCTVECFARLHVLGKDNVKNNISPPRSQDLK